MGSKRGRVRKKPALDLLESSPAEPTTSVSGATVAESEPTPVLSESVKSVEEKPEKVTELVTAIPEKDEVIIKRRGRRKIAEPEMIQKLEPELLAAEIPDAKPETQSTKKVVAKELEKSPPAVVEKEVTSQEKVVKPRGRKKVSVSEVLEKLTKEKLLRENDQPP